MEIKISIIKLFFLFLKNENSLKEFIMAVKREKQIEFNILKQYPCSLISSSFDWRMTRNGFNYWLDINTKWCEFLKSTDLYHELDVKKIITIYMRKKDELIDITEWSNEW